MFALLYSIMTLLIVNVMTTQYHKNMRM